MADAKLTALTAASALAAADLFYVSQSAASRKATGTQLLALVGTTYVPLAGGTMTGALTINTGAATTLSADLSGYLRVGSVTTFEHKGLTAITGLLISSTSAFQFVRAYGFIDANAWASIGANSFGGTTGVGIAATSALQWSTVHAASGAVGVSLWMDAAAQLALRNGTTAQRMHIYGTYTDSSNLERLTLSTTAGTSVNITAETLGTGGNNLDIVLTPAGNGSLKLPGSTSIDASGYGILTGCRFSTSVGVNYYSTGVRMRSTAELAWTSGLVDVGVDLAFHRDSAGVAAIDNGTAGTWRDLKLRNLLVGGGDGSYVQTPSMKVTNLAAAEAAGAGARAFVTDADATTFLSTVHGGGSYKVPVVSDGTDWLIG